MLDALVAIRRVEQKEQTGVYALEEVPCFCGASDQTACQIRNAEEMAGNGRDAAAGSLAPGRLPQNSFKVGRLPQRRFAAIVYQHGGATKNIK